MALQSVMNGPNINDSIIIATCFVRANPEAIEGSDVSKVVARLVKNFHDFRSHEIMPQANFAILMRAKRAEDEELAHALLWRALSETLDRTYEGLVAQRIKKIALMNKRQTLYHFGSIVIRALCAFANEWKLTSFVVSSFFKRTKIFFMYSKKNFATFGKSRYPEQTSL